VSVNRQLTTALSREVRDLLEASGLQWSLENGKRHPKLFVAGRLVLVLPRSGRTGLTNGRNQIAAVRRAIKQLGEQP